MTSSCKVCEIEAQEIVSNNFRVSPRGNECTFVKISDQIGVKLFNSGCSEDFVNKVYDQQELAAEHSFGPDVYGKFQIVIDGITRFGYFTEIVEILECEYFDSRHVMRSRYFTDEELVEVSELSKKLQEIGIHESTIGDLYECNIGFKTFNSRREMVCIDFGHC